MPPPAPVASQLGTALASGQVSQVSIPVPAGGVPSRRTILVFVQSAVGIDNVSDTAGNSYVSDLLYTSPGSGLILQVFRASSTALLDSGNQIVVQALIKTAVLMAAATAYFGLATLAPFLDNAVASSGVGTVTTSGNTPLVSGGPELVVSVVATFRNTFGVQTFIPDPGYITTVSLQGANPQSLGLFVATQFLAAAGGPQSAGSNLSISTYWSAACVVYPPAPVSSVGVASPPDSTLFIPTTPHAATPVPFISTKRTRIT